MSRIEWNAPGERKFEAGCDRGVFYPRVGPGVPWNGLVGVSEQAGGGDVESLYFDGYKFLDYAANEDFVATLEAFTSPPEFAPCDGVKAVIPGLFVTQQPRKTFGLCYRTLIGNDLESTDYGYKIHLVYNITAGPSPRSYKTLTGTAAAETRSWELNAVPPPASTFKPTAHVVIDSTQVDPSLLEVLETALYGRDAAGNQPAKDPYLPTVDQIVRMFASKVTQFVTETV